MEFSNPAKRLYVICKEIQSIKQAVTCAEAWSLVLGVPKDDQTSLLIELSQLQKLIKEVKQKIEDDKTIKSTTSLKYFPQLEKIINDSIINLNNPWNSINHLNETILHPLEFCDDLLSKNYSEKIIKEEELTKIREEVENLINLILTSETLEYELRRIYLDLLDIIRNSIIDYKIGGIKSIERAIQTSYGIITYHHNKIKQDNFIDKIKFPLKRLQEWVVLVKDVKELATTIQGLLN